MLNNEFPPLGGGTATVNQAILQCFKNNPDLKIDLVTSALGKEREEELFADHIKIYKVPVDNKCIHHSSNRELITYSLRGLWLTLKLTQKTKYDLCFAWSAVPAGAVAYCLHLLRRIPYLVRVCGPDIPGFEKRYTWCYRLLTPLIRAVWRHARAVIAKCRPEAEMITNIDPSVSVSIIRNGVDTASFADAARVPDEGPLRLLCVGRLIDRKGQEQLFEAISRLREEGSSLFLDLVGTGDSEAYYRKRVSTLGIDDLVRFVGYVPRNEIAKHYAAAHVFVLPSFNEGMSVATLEAMAAGLPLVVTDCPGMEELVEEETNGLTFSTGDIDALTRHLSYLNDNREITRQMGEASRQRATRFSWSSVADVYLDLFTDSTER